MAIVRSLKIGDLLEKKSFFLLGPRSTGKSTLIGQQLKSRALIIDLLESDVALRLTQRPQELENFILGTDHKIIVIDEIQKIPELLDEVHRLIEKYKKHFLLTGSSARKLKSSRANLLAGRAWMAHMFPLTSHEIPRFNLEKYLMVGGLPHVYLSSEPHEELKAYIQTYLFEEIKAEGIIRKIPAFSRFMETAALSNGQLLNFTEIASDAGLSSSTIREYYCVLEDTLMGYLLNPWIKSKKRKAIQTGKFYIFDPGVCHALTKTLRLDRNSDMYGRAFEHFIGNELRSYLSYSRSIDALAFWRSINGQEVDFLIGDHTAIEVKAGRKITSKYFAGLKALREEGVFKKFYLISQDPQPAKHDFITCLPWNHFLEKLWAGEL